MAFPAYPPGPFTPEFCVGGFGGGQFSDCNWVTDQKALVVTKLQIWWNSDMFVGVQTTFSDNSVAPIHGQPLDQSATLTLAPGEQVTSLTLWGNGVGTRTGHIRIITNKGQTFDCGKNISSQKSYSAPVGSGILVGMVGRSGDAIDMLGAVFLDGSVLAVTLTIPDPKDGNGNGWIDQLAGTSKGISSVVLDSVHYQGATVKGTDWDFHGSASRTESTTYTQGSSTMFGASASVTVKGSLFGIGGSATTGFTWSTTKNQEQSATTSNETTLSWGVSGHLDPGQGLTVSSISALGTGRARYLAIVTIILSDGTTTTDSEPGIFNNVFYDTAYVQETPDTEDKLANVIEGFHM